MNILFDNKTPKQERKRKENSKRERVKINQSLIQISLLEQHQIGIALHPTSWTEHHCLMLLLMIEQQPLVLTLYHRIKIKNLLLMMTVMKTHCWCCKNITDVPSQTLLFFSPVVEKKKKKMRSIFYFKKLNFQQKLWVILSTNFFYFLAAEVLYEKDKCGTWFVHLSIQSAAHRPKLLK